MEAENQSKTESSKSFAQKEKIQDRVSVRFHLQLTDSTDRSFPEFSYLELLGKNKNKKKDEETLQDGECNVDEIRALAKKFEDKYGPKSTGKKCKGTKTDRVQDLVDVTYGYDVTDAFVDDSEAYDELVPADWTTEHGGFYINMGELNFRPASSGDEKSDGDFKESKKKKTPKKKNKENKEKKMKDGKRHLSSSEKEKSSKKMRLNSDEKETKLQKLKKRINLDAGKNLSKEPTSQTASQQTKPTKTVSSLSVNLQSPVIKLEKNNINELRTTLSTNNSSKTMEDSSINKDNENSNTPSVTLPDGLPPSLILSIQKLIEAARKAGGDAGKCKFFNSDVNRILLQIETDSRKLNCRARSAVYDYLALFLPCTKDTLLKRAKNLFMQEQVGRLREPLLKLRVAIEAAMPSQVKNYEEEVAKLSEEQALQNQKSCNDTANQNGEKKDDVVMKDLEVDGENEKIEESATPTDVNAPTTPSEDKGKRAILPKRFVWKDDIRNLLCDVVGIKVELYLMSKSRSTTAEEALKGFLETEVRPLWPKGWMTTRILYRESKQAHVKVTSAIAVKAKKDAKRPKEEESKTQNTNQQATAMAIDQKNGDGPKPTNLTAISVSKSSNVLKSTSIMKTPDAVRPNELDLSTNKQSIKPKPSVESKSEVKVSVNAPVVGNYQAMSKDVSRVMNPLQTQGESIVKEQGHSLGQSQLKLQDEPPVKPQSQIQLQPQVSTQIKTQDLSSLGVSQIQTKEKNPNETSAMRTPLQDTLKSQPAEKPRILAQSSGLVTTQSKSQVELPEKKDTNSHDKLNLKSPSFSPGLSMHGQTHSLPTSQLADHSLLKPQSAFKIKDKVKPRPEEDESSLRKLLGLAEVQTKDSSHIQLQGHLQNQTTSNMNTHGQRSTVQNSQSNPHIQSHVQPITQQTGQGKGRGQILAHAHNQTQGQLKTSSYRQSQLESNNRIQNQLQALTHPQSQLQGQLQGQFHNAAREDQGHPLSQIQSMSPSPPRILSHNNPPQRIQAPFSSPTNINKPKATGKTILDLLDEVSPPRNTQAFHSAENRPLSHATAVSSPLSSCSFQNVAQQHRISPPRNIKAPNSMAVSSSPPLSSPNMHSIRNVSPIRQMSNNTGTFSNISPPKRLSSCSLQNIPSKLNQETPQSPRSPRQGYNYLSKVPSSPNLSCQFPMQSARSSPESHQRTSHLNTLAPNYMALSSSDKPSTQLTATSLLNSIVNMSQNHVSPNLPLAAQSSNPLQNNGVSMSNNPLAIPSMMNLQNNVPNNKPQPGPSFPTNMKNFAGIPRPQFPNQTSMLRNNLPTELNDGNNRIPNFQPAYRPFS